MDAPCAGDEILHCAQDDTGAGSEFRIPNSEFTKDGSLMWYCPFCGTENGDSGGFCTECGLPRPSYAPKPKASKSRKRKKKKSLWWLWLPLWLAVLGFTAYVCYRHVHLWAPASCTEPETCVICGKTMGHALGHEPIPATCLEPETCSRCGAVLDPPLGHDWAAANYDRPETCQRCGETRGNPKGWIGNLSGHVGEEDLKGLFGFGESHPYLLDEPVHKAFRITLMLKISFYDGNPFGEWGLYARDLTGKWELLKRFTVPGPGNGEFQCFPLELDGASSFDALSFLPMTIDNYNIDYSFYFTDVQEYVD